MSYRMFSHVSRAPGTLVHKAVGETGARYDSSEGGVGCGVGFDGARTTRCGRLLPPAGSAEREALQPPEDSALRWTEVTCPACLARRYGGVPLGRDPASWCACGHGQEEHHAGGCWNCGSLLSRRVCGPVASEQLKEG
ncbi:MAG TPA: hypothetical protein VJ957_02755 [Longimicrobiales bacterium]|nr:hypothetical protein [Longimicrobiales bacterium]